MLGVCELKAVFVIETIELMVVVRCFEGVCSRREAKGLTRR